MNFFYDIKKKLEIRNLSLWAINNFFSQKISKSVFDFTDLDEKRLK